MTRREIILTGIIVALLVLFAGMIAIWQMDRKDYAEQIKDLQKALDKKVEQEAQVEQTIPEEKPAVSVAKDEKQDTDESIILLNNPDYATIKVESIEDTGYGTANLIVYVTNHMKDRLKFWFQDSYVNDEAVMIHSGYEVASGKSGRFKCDIPLDLLSVSSASEIATIETHISLDRVITDEYGYADYDRIGDTPRMTINMKDHSVITE